MNLDINNWIKFIYAEGIENGKHNYKYYAFDWDDNIVHMPTKIMFLDSDKNEVGMTTLDFAEKRQELKKGPIEYNGSVIKDFAPEPFRYFRPKADKIFLKDAIGPEVKLGPSWNDFVECINTASIFSIITARGHKPSTLKRAVYRYIISNFNGIDSSQVISNIKKYNKIFDALGKDASIMGYLDLCKFYPVSYFSGDAGSPEELKVKFFNEFIEYCKKINKGMPIKVGFSDDDAKNVELIQKHFGEPRDLVKVSIKYTGKGK